MLYLKKDSLQTRKALQSGLVLVSTGGLEVGEAIRSGTLR